MAFCTFCGKQLAEGAAFCGACGKPVVQIAQQTPVQETPVQETPVQEAPVQETPVQEAPVQEAPVQEAPVQEAPVQEAPVQETPTQEVPVQTYQQQAYQQPYQQQYQQQPYQQQAYQQQYQQQPYQQQAYQQQPYQQQPYQQPVQPIYDDVAQSRGVAWLAYLGPLFLIPFFVKKHFRFARFHVKEGATLFACELAYSITTSILLTLIDLPTREYYFYGVYVHSGIYDVMNVILNLAHIFFVVCAIMGIVRAATGKKLELPLIGKIPFIKMLMNKWYTAMGVDVSDD